MRKLTILIMLLLAAVKVAYGCDAFYQGEYTEGLTKICIYDHIGSPYAITVNSYDVCPVVIYVGH